MKLGLALAGGGMRGIAHAGFLKALEENNIKIDVITGTSSGSHVAVLHALGFSGEEILSLFKKYAFTLVGTDTETIVLNKMLFNAPLKFDSFRSGKPIEDLYNKIALEKGYHYMKDLKIPVATVSTDVMQEKEFISSSLVPDGSGYVDDIDIGTAVRASSSFSVVFDPCPYKDKLLLDGGILNNLPANIAKTLGADKIISIKFSSSKIDTNSNIVQIGMKTIDMMSNKICESNFKNSDLILTIPSNGTGLLDIDNIDFCFESGYKVATKYIDDIKKLVNL